MADPAGDFLISSEPEAGPEAVDALRRGLHDYNAGETGLDAPHPVRVFVRDRQGRILGGLLGEVWGGWLHLKILWVAETHRGRGLGRRLLEAAEDEAAEHGVQGCFLSTFDFQAPGFYQRLGYEVYGELPGYPPDHTTYHLRKWLARR
jgi:ribosomal protein S18 acetylase RimI-like enzyme